MSTPAPATYPAQPTADAPARWPVRVWPGLVILAGVVLLMVVPGRVVPRTMMHFIAVFAAPSLGAILAVGWWVFAARVRGRDRWLFRVPRPGPRRPPQWRHDRHRLGRPPAGTGVEAADRPGVGLVRGRRRPALHAGAARRQRGDRLLRRGQRGRGVGAPLAGPVPGGD